MPHDEYKHQARQTVALERIAELLGELKDLCVDVVTAVDLHIRWTDQEAARAEPALSFTEQEADRNARGGS